MLRDLSLIRSYPAVGLVPVFLFLVSMAGCSDPQQAGVAEAPPPSVIAVRAEVRPVTEQSRFVGRVSAVHRVELKARVEGFLKERRFEEGQMVNTGDVLFEIEPDQYEAVVNQRKADLTSAIADEKNASAQLKRGEELLKTKAMPASQVDKLRAEEAIAKAKILQAQAALRAAELELGYTQVTSPIDGRIGLVNYTQGNLVKPTSGTLATIVSLDPIYIRFPLTQRELLQARRKIQERGSGGSVVVKAHLPDETLYEHDGDLNFVDVTTDPGTDTVILRAEFPNPDGILVDGQYVGVVVQPDEPQSEVVIPMSSLQVDQQGFFIMIVDAENRAQIRRIEKGARQGANIAILDGLKEGELVIAQGVQKVRPGQVVAPAPPQAPESAPK
jgi:membrane fusion protein (multidrug efflux system)